jgi:hypothetical protein
MNVQIRSASTNSVNLSWDPFLPETVEGALYVVFYTDQYMETMSSWPGILEVRSMRIKNLLGT